MNASPHNLLKFLPYVLVGFAACAALLKLIAYSQIPFHDWDESIYAQVAREWVQQPGIFLRYNGSDWLEKPPLPIAVIGVLFAIFGERELIARLPSLSLFAILCMLTLRLSKTITRQPLFHNIPLLVLFASPFIQDRSAVVNVDMYLSVGWIGYFAYANWPIPKIFFVLLGTLSKSLLGLFPVAVECAYRTITHNLTRKKCVELAALCAVGVVWHVLAYFRFGDLFVQEHLLDHLIARVTRVIELHFGGRKYYALVLLQDLGASWIAILFGFAGAILYLRSTKRNPFASAVMVPISAVVFFAFLTISRSKLSWYVVPLIPLFAVTTAWTPYLLSALRNGLFKRTILIAISVSVISAYARQIITDGVSLTSFKPIIPDHVALARCIAQSNAQNITVLLDPQSRKDRNVIEAAQLHIGSSFRYGGMPAFVYYVNRPVTFHYKQEEVVSKIDFIDTLVVHSDDVAPLIVQLAKKENTSLSFVAGCESGSWRTFMRQDN
jgi:4-amino-4-deoxy-L-arabinose transferase-like glycosyltransferase